VTIALSQPFDKLGAQLSSMGEVVNRAFATSHSGTISSFLFLSERGVK
jgi:hypothetical protein